jgi:Carboxypeptidase regulatory-like domain
VSDYPKAVTVERDSPMNLHRARIPLFPKRTMCAGILTLLTLPAAGAAQEKPGTIEGVVVDRVTGQSVSSAVVAVTPNDFTVYTGADGRFRVDAVTSGLHGLAVHAVGYADLVEPNIVVRPGDVTRVTLQLDPASSSGPRAGGQTAGAPPNTAHKSKIPFGVGIGVAAERRIAADRNASDTWGVTVLPRFIGLGLGAAIDFPWTETGAVKTLGSAATELGVIRMKPSMAGVMWQQPLVPGLSADIQFVAGYSFNSVAKSDKSAVRAQVAVPQAVTDIGNSFAWETRLAVWREVGPRLGLMVAGRYLHTRPQFTFADGTQRVWKADRVTLEAGLAFTVIKAPWAR